MILLHNVVTNFPDKQGTYVNGTGARALVAIWLAVVFSAVCFDWSIDIQNLIRAGLKELRGHVESCTDSYSVVISFNLEADFHCLFLFFH